MAYRYRKSRASTRRRSSARPRKRASSRRRAGSRTQRIVIQVVGAPGGVLASPMTLGSKSLKPMRARF